MEQRKIETDRANTGRNQEWSNLDSSEKRGLKKLKKRIKNRELLKINTDESGKLMAMQKRLLFKMWNKRVWRREISE